MAVLDLFKLTGKTALVVGGGQGFGRHLALSLAEAMAEVIIADMNEKTGMSVVHEIESAGGRARFIKTDVNKKEDLPALMTEISDGGLDIAVNVPYVSWETARDYCNAEAEIMKKRGRGKIINVASISAAIVNAGDTYCVNKAALVMLSKCLAVELGPYNINVNCISPSYTLTPGRRFDTPAFKQRVRALTPMGWYERPEDICGTAIFLASRASDYITGQNILVDGRHTLNAWLGPFDHAAQSAVDLVVEAKREKAPLVSPEEETVSMKHDMDVLGIKYDENGMTLN